MNLKKGVKEFKHDSKLEKHGRKIATFAEPYLFGEIDKAFYIAELKETHNRIHEAWFYMKGATYELFHFLIMKELLDLGEDYLSECEGELNKFFLSRYDNVNKIKKKIASEE